MTDRTKNTAEAVVVGCLAGWLIGVLVSLGVLYFCDVELGDASL